MRIKTKLMLLVLSVVLAMGIISMIISVKSMRKQAQTELAATENTLLNHKKEMLKIVIGNAYAVIETAYNEANNPQKLTNVIKKRLKNAVDIAYGSLKGIHERVDVTEEEKKKLAIEVLSELRYDGDHYFWIVTLNLDMISDPLHPTWEGKNLSGLKDISGKPIFPNLLDISVKNKEKDAYFDYMWEKPGTKQPDPKIAYARIFEPWGWAIGSGMSVEVVEEGLQERAKKTVGSLRYGADNNEYFWINDTKPRMVMHPMKPQLDGKDIGNIQDPNKKYLFKEMVEVSQKEGEGFVEYMWPKPGEENPVQKVSYVKLFKPYNWIVGTGVYIDDVAKSIAATKKELDKRLIKGILTQSLLLLVMCVVILIATLFVARKISLPLIETSQMLKDIAEGEGDLTMRLNTTSKDEIGEMALWFNTFIEKLQGIIKQIAENSTSVGASSTQLSQISKELLSSAEETSHRSTSVASASEEMSANLDSVAAAMEQSSTNTDMVATAAEEMSATISEIAENAEKAKSVSMEAVGQAENASAKMNALADAANKIGKVTETITEISEQTNLLALNATIEAARAGEAGKGFAVVANEIKELAKQTAEATLDIKTLIEDVQTNTSSAGDEISQVAGVITGVNEIVSSIAIAVEEQTAATREIANNIAQASQGIQEVNENVSQSSTVSTEISQDIAGVSAASQTISDRSNEVQSSSQELLERANELNKIVGSFKV